MNELIKSLGFDAEYILNTIMGALNSFLKRNSNKEWTTFIRCAKRKDDKGEYMQSTIHCYNSSGETKGGNVFKLSEMLNSMGDTKMVSYAMKMFGGKGAVSKKINDIEENIHLLIEDGAAILIIPSEKSPLFFVVDDIEGNPMGGDVSIDITENIIGGISEKIKAGMKN